MFGNNLEFFIMRNEAIKERAKNVVCNEEFAID
jgi:hypothetical protein